MFMWCVLSRPIEVALRVVDDDVGVGAGLDDALPPVQAEHARRRGARELHPALERDLAGHDALVHEVHAVLDRADAVRDLPEVAEAELLLVLHAERAVVGRDHLQVVRAQGLPHRVLVALGTRRERRRAHPLGPLERAPLALRAELVFERQVEVLRARLAVDVLALVARPRELLDGLLRRHVHHVERRTRELREHDRAVRRLLLHLPGAGDAVVVRVGLALVDELLGEHVDRRAVLGVHHREHAGVAGDLHGLQDLRVIRVEDARVGHEQLEARDALVGQSPHRLEGGLVDVADDLVEAVVDRAVAAAFSCQAARPSSTRWP